MNYPYANTIIPKIWIGDVHSSQDKNFLKSNNIQIIVNCTKDLPNYYEPFPIKELDTQFLEDNFIKYYRIPVDDNGRQEEVKNFWQFTNNISPKVLQDYHKDKNILVHCSAGQQRSCAFVAFLLKQLGLTDEQAFGLIVEKRPNAFNFGKQINFAS
jgi:protein-tyrosine phosphatase